MIVKDFHNEFKSAISDALDPYGNYSCSTPIFTPKGRRDTGFYMKICESVFTANAYSMRLCGLSGIYMELGKSASGDIVEGCYIPFNWRRDFDEQYLMHIRFTCLAMTAEYIENHFDEIISHESKIETRLVDADCTIASLTVDNKRYTDGFQNAGERIVLIDDDYEETIKALINHTFYR